MKREIVIVGRGGQGVLLMGRILGLAAIHSGLYAVATESYAAETRGGESRSDVIIADNMFEVDYVKAYYPDVLVMMFPFTPDRYRSMLKESSTVFVDSEYVNPDIFAGWKTYAFKYSKLAEEKLGTRRVANIVILGHMIKTTGWLSVDTVKKAIEEMISEKWREINLKALDLGYNL